MCFPFPFFRPGRPYKRFDKDLPCSCDLCGKEFTNMSYLITHMGYHKTDEINRHLIHGYGTVRCNKCWESFPTVAAMDDHKCVIQGLSPVQSCESLETILIHD